MDAEGLLRVGGRVQNSNLGYEARYSILLPKHHPVTDAIITQYQTTFLYSGPQFLLATIRQRYKPIGGLNAFSSIINKYIRCFQMRPQHLGQLMSPLPAEHVQSSPKI